MAEDDKNKKPDGKAQELLVPKSPREITPENAHLVDFENLKVRLICLISIPNAFTNVANFLKRRGWEVFVTTELKEALSQVGTYKPDFVMVSVNNTHKKIKQFPQIVMQTFNVPTIVFGEKTDSKTLSSIQASRSSHKIMGHLSGPTAQRKIKSILQARYQPEPESKEGNRSFTSHSSENMRFNSDSKKEESIPLKFSGRKSEQKGGIIFEKNQAFMRRADGYNPFHSGGQQDGGVSSQSGSAYDPTQSEDYYQSEENKKPLSTAEQMQKDKEEMAAALRELGSDIGSGDLDNGDESDNKSITLESINSKQTKAGTDSKDNKSKDGYIMESEYIRKKRCGLYYGNRPDEKQSISAH